MWVDSRLVLVGVIEHDLIACLAKDLVIFPSLLLWRLESTAFELGSNLSEEPITILPLWDSTQSSADVLAWISIKIKILGKRHSLVGKGLNTTTLGVSRIFALWA